ncbi:hypothetical protein TWF173_005487 [Orbilia oligospora]|nr:hypothetical protein TWF173_005487 [Orbilia oligospora]
MSDKLFSTPFILQPAAGPKLQPIPEGNVATPVEAPVVEPTIDAMNNPVTNQERLHAKLGLLRDMIGNIEGFRYHDDDDINVSRLASKLICEFLNDVTHVQNLAIKTVIDTAREVDNAPSLNLDQLKMVNERYKTVIKCVSEVPQHIQTAMGSIAMARLPAQEATAYKTDMESRIAKEAIIRIDIEHKIIGVEAKIEAVQQERRAAFDDFTLVTRRKSVKREEPNEFDTRPKRFQSSRY